MNKNTIFLVLFLLSICSGKVFGAQRLLNSLWPSGTMYNKTDAEVIKDQAGGFFSGGSIIIRGSRSTELNPLSIQSPSFSFDPCTGSADFRFGGFSFISSKEMLTFLQRTAKSTGMYAAKMMLKIHCPQCETVMSELERISREVSHFSLNQCSLSQSIANSALSKLTVGDKQNCMMKNNAAKQSSDLFASSRVCNDNPDTNKDVEKEEFASQLGNEFNLVWKAFKQGGVINTNTIGDINLGERVMSITGTIIGRKVGVGSGSKWTFTRKPSLFQDLKQLGHYIGSYDTSAFEGYTCDEHEKCLNPTLEKMQFGHNSLYRSVSIVIADLTKKILENQPLGALTNDEKRIIEMSNIPIIKMIEQDLIIKGGSSNPLVANSELIELISLDFAIEYLTRMINLAKNELSKLALSSSDSDLLKEFNNDVELVKQHLHEHKMSAFQRVNNVMQVKESFKLQDEQIKSRFSRIFSTHTRN